MNDRLITPSCLNTEYRASRRYPLLQKSNALFPYINVKKIPPQVTIKISVANIINTIVSIYILPLHYSQVIIYFADEFIPKYFTLFHL